MQPAPSVRTRLLLQLGGGALALLAAAWVFGVIAHDVVSGAPLTVLDAELAQWLHRHATPPLTARDAVDLEGVAGILSELTGRTVRRVVADDDEWVSGLIGHGVPEAQATMLLGMFLASRRGEFATTDPALEDLIGREPTPVRDVLEGVTQ